MGTRLAQRRRPDRRSPASRTGDRAADADPNRQTALLRCGPPARGPHHGCRRGSGCGRVKPSGCDGSTSTWKPECSPCDRRSNEAAGTRDSANPRPCAASARSRCPKSWPRPCAGIERGNLKSGSWRAGGGATSDWSSRRGSALRSPKTELHKAFSSSGYAPPDCPTSVITIFSTRAGTLLSTSSESTASAVERRAVRGRPAP